MPINTLISSVCDATTITIHRFTKVGDGYGGYTWAETVLPGQDVGIYYHTTRGQREYNLPEGEVKRAVLGVLATDGTDIQWSHDAYDQFEYRGRAYRVVGVRPYTGWIPDHIQADCVAV